MDWVAAAGVTGARQQARDGDVTGPRQVPTNMTIDGTALHAAAAAHGLGQLVLARACVTYHQPHPRSYNTRGSMLPLAAYEALAQQLVDAGPAANLAPAPPDRREWHRWSAPDGGLANESLPQVRPRPGHIAGPRRAARRIGLGRCWFGGPGRPAGRCLSRAVLPPASPGRPRCRAPARLFLFASAVRLAALRPAA